MRKLRYGIVCGLVAIGSIALATPAQASLSDCVGSRLCLWADNDYGNIIIRDPATSGSYNLGGALNNAMDSWANQRSVNGAGYDKADLKGDCQTFRAGAKDNNVSVFNSDEVSSLILSRGC